jgi:hypothetical protein
LCVASQRLESSIINAVGYDVHLATTSPLSIGQRTTVIFGAGVPEMEVGVPGIIHWVNSAKGDLEAGIALQEQVPDAFEVRIPGCQRNSLRYACRLSGTMHWTTDTPCFATAVAMNYSRDGLCFQASIAPPVETNISFRWRNADRDSKIDGTIRWVIGQEGKFLIGCELQTDRGYSINGILA